MNLVTASSGAGLASDVAPWLGVLVIVVLIGVGAISLTRKWLHRDENAPGDFSLHQLRELHAAGSLTDEEFERAKSLVIGRLTTEETPDKSDGEPPSNG